MDNKILEVVIGLALIYATLSVLAMKLQEVLAGNLLRYRVGTLHDLLLEAVGRDETLKKKILDNPLVSVLYKGAGDAERGFFGGSGPSAIPPGIFSRALLAELNGGEPPQSVFATPSAFLGAKRPSGKAPVIWQSLATLLPGSEANWPGFEAAIARWFADIGDRSDGWFKRSADWWALGVAFALAFSLNVDSFQIARALGADPALRLGLADLAARVDAFRASEPGGKSVAAPDSLAARPMQQLGARMTDAITRLNDVFLRDKDINQYSARMAPVGEHCKQLLQPTSANASLGSSSAANSPKTGQLGRKNEPGTSASTAPPPASSPVLGPESKLSDSQSWVLVLPLLQSRIESAQFKSDADARKIFEDSYNCVSQVSSWVRSATVFSSNPAVRTSMQEAASALESVKSALVALRDQQSPSASLSRSFIADPEAFETCKNAASRSDFDLCLQRELSSTLRLPLGHGGAASREQLCEPRVGIQEAPKVGKVDVVVTISQGAAASAQVAAIREQPAEAWASDWPCGARFEGNERLGLPQIRLVGKGWGGWLLALAGWLVTMFFVALGAPFWFDLLGKAVKIRSAGNVRDDAADDRRGRGTLPPPAAAPQGPGPAGPAPAPGAGPFAAGRNAFEDNLIAADLIRLQQALGVEQTGLLDETTRLAVKAWCHENGVTPETDTLSATLFLRIVRRPATQAAGSVGGTTRPRAGSRHELAPVLAKALNKVLAKPAGRVPDDLTVISDDLRAMAVLYRYKVQRDAGAAAKDCTVLQLAQKNPAALDEIDDALLAAIRADADSGKTYAPEQPGWMDFAIGEVGQAEHDASTRAASNPRICDYLDKARAGAGDDGDHTPWCGAYVGWVLSRYAATLGLDAERQALALPKEGALRAANWKTWGRDLATGEQPAYGDIVVFPSNGPDSSGHVAFVVSADAQTIWALGGNQQRGTRVSMSAFDRAAGTVVRKPGATAAPATPATPGPTDDDHLQGLA